MQTDVLTNITSWAIAILAYPGFLFAIALALTGEWIASALRPIFTPRLYRNRVRKSGFFDPLLTLFKLLSRKDAVHWQSPLATNDPTGTASTHPAENALSVIGAIAPILALALMPISGNPVTQELGLHTDLVLLLALLATYPIASAAAQARSGGLSLLEGAQTLGALLTGLLPALVVVTALVQVARATTLNMDSLLAAPETPQQTFVRLLCAAALLIALPWWLGRRPAQRQTELTSAGAQAGKLFQTAALAVFWSVLVLPATGDLTWSILIMTLGSLFAATSMRVIGERWWPTRRTAEAANLVWATTLPLALVALLLSII
ncbi:MAG: hypothetical protein ABIQ44_01030 [Chloroflexia bacterium]